MLRNNFRKALFLCKKQNFEWDIVCLMTYFSKINHTESKNHLSWKRHLRSSGPAFGWLPCQQDKVELSAMCCRFLETFRDSGSATSMGSLFQWLTTLSVKKFLMMSPSECPLVQLEAMSSQPVTGGLGREAAALSGYKSLSGREW